VLSPSNTPAKVNRQRIVARSAGTEQLWVVDAERRTVQVTELGGANVYSGGDCIPLRLFEDATILAEQIIA
jgi:Uma2 family endonuclease